MQPYTEQADPTDPPVDKAKGGDDPHDAGRKSRDPPDSRIRGSTRSTRIGLALIFLGILIFVANRVLPLLWMEVPMVNGQAGGGSLNWDDLRNPEAFAYEQRLLVWPLVTSTALVATGVLTFAWSRLQQNPSLAHLAGMEDAEGSGLATRILLALRSSGKIMLLWGCLWMGFILALTATRWFGFYRSQLAQETIAIHLHIVPYLNLLMGLLLMGVAIVLIARTHRSGLLPDHPLHRWVMTTSAVAGSGLLLLPLFPFAYLVTPLITMPLEEFTLAFMRDQGSGEGPTPPVLFGLARVSLWATLIIASVAAVTIHAGWFRSTRRAFDVPGYAFAVAAPIILLGALLSIWAYVRLPGWRGGIEPVLNPILILVWTGLVIAWVMVLLRAGRTRQPRSHKATG